MKFLDSPSSKPTTHLERCSRVRFCGAQCDKCLSVCPAHAIRIAYPFLEIDDTCSGCGFCVATCPNEVFAFPADTPGFMKSQERPGTIYCSGLLGQGPIPAKALPLSVVPCLGSISSSFILAWSLQEEKPLEVVTGSCNECPMRTGENDYRQREREIRSLFNYLGIGFSPVKVSAGSDAEGREVSRQYEVFQAHVAEAKSLSRRDFFRHLRDHAVTNRREPAREGAITGEVGAGHRGPTESTRLFIEIFRRYAGGESLKDRIVPGFTEIHVDENCTGCGACASLCLTGALTVDESPEAVRLLWRPSHCSRCDLCFDVCGRKALHMLPCLDANKIVGETRSVVKEFHRHVCPECGNRFLSSGPAVCCSDCLKAGNLMEALSMMIYGEERRTVP